MYVATKRKAQSAPKARKAARAARLEAKPAPRSNLVEAREKRPHDDPLIQRLREICMALPEADERTSHGEPTWFAGKGRVFATLDNHHHGATQLSVWLPQPLGVQQMLLEADPECFFRPPYVGVSGWIGVPLDMQLDWQVVASLVRDAYLHVATLKLAKQLKAREQT
jgi:hypothetical protein